MAMETIQSKIGYDHSPDFSHAQIVIRVTSFDAVVFVILVSHLSLHGVRVRNPHPRLRNGGYTREHFSPRLMHLLEGAVAGRVESKTGAVAVGAGSSCCSRLSPDVSASFCSVAPFPVSAHRTGRAVFPRHRRGSPTGFECRLSAVMPPSSSPIACSETLKSVPELLGLRQSPRSRFLHKRPRSEAPSLHHARGRGFISTMSLSDARSGRHLKRR
jgi:hypothetical protein